MDTKKSLGAVALALALIGAGCSTPANAPSSGADTASTPNNVSDVQPMKYKDFKAGITLYYPGDWKEQAQASGNGVVFLAKADAEGFHDSVGFATQDLSKFPPITIDQYTGIIKDDTTKRLKNANILSTETLTIGGKDAGVMTYTAEYPEQPDKPMKVRNTYVMNDKTMYILTYTATVDSFDTYLPQAKAIEASFTFDAPME
ncbi:MAG: hypothetical protein COX82_04865 [Candidatus Magasanikbacteria bacterium CG_4_10_14_0_2_um_filter_41_10]|uniref:PsbP C-terminal domain-containing protein n=1 Tax=Candidatus Magasanikbacteria bacterium CG_4_10_14_0_2_um_filter_41_10 TaxID=1974638 RepID=A0A2M7V1Z2_9BACT|nr:MAG: hypothetical protein COX82_04865 [Candidatus Magasanikbacteria bacterium CG_4_10_14_0_2_um_filter_41_10]